MDFGPGINTYTDSIYLHSQTDGISLEIFSFKLNVILVLYS